MATQVTQPHPQCKLTLNYLDPHGGKIGTYCPKCERLGTQCYVEDHPEQSAQGKYLKYHSNTQYILLGILF